MRCTQPMGLSNGGSDFIGQFEFMVKEVGIRTYPDGTKEPFERDTNHTTLKAEESGNTSGMYGDNILWKYTTKDGRVFYEYVQECEWDSGPMEFYALKDSDGKTIEETLWTEEELNAILQPNYEEVDDPDEK